MSIASVSDVGLVRLVASGYRWVHGSATEMAVVAPFRCRAPRMLAGFGAKIMAEARSHGTRAPLNFAINRTVYGKLARGRRNGLRRSRPQAGAVSPVRQGLTQVPIRSGVLSLRRAATTES